MVDYENTDGFSETGWSPTSSVQGFGWENISVVSAGVQYRGVDRFPLRLGYTYSSNPLSEDVAFFNVPATAIIKNAIQLGFSFIANDNLSLDAVYHHGTIGGATEGQLLCPFAIAPGNPLGALQGTSVSYEMTTDMIMVGFSYNFTW
jgi:long-chain fatty acid transport protein